MEKTCTDSGINRNAAAGIVRQSLLASEGTQGRGDTAHTAALTHSRTHALTHTRTHTSHRDHEEDLTRNATETGARSVESDVRTAAVATYSTRPSLPV